MPLLPLIVSRHAARQRHWHSRHDYGHKSGTLDIASLAVEKRNRGTNISLGSRTWDVVKGIGNVAMAQQHATSRCLSVDADYIALRQMKERKKDMN